MSDQEPAQTRVRQIQAAAFAALRQLTVNPLMVSNRVAQQVYCRLRQQFGCPIPHRWEHQQLGFWASVLTLDLPIVICEGAKKAGCLLSHGYPTIALPGVWNGRRAVKDANGRTSDRRLIPELARFATPGRSIIFCFDQDPKPTTQQDVFAAMMATAERFEVQQCVCYGVSWELEWGKGIDDVAAMMGSELVQEIMGDWGQVNARSR